MQRVRLAGLGGALLGLAIAATPAAAQEREVTIVTWGGNVAREMLEAWFKPATAGMNVRIREDSLKGPNDVRAHVGAGNVRWDVVDAATDMCERNGRDGILEPLDFGIIDKAGLPPSQVTTWSVPSTAYTTVLAWNKKTYKDRAPTSWKDLFDVQRFPGTRFFPPFATATLEIALLADGVEPDKLYPLDVDRAFRKLESFKPHITGFVSSFGAATQMIMDGEADMILLPENRLFAAIRNGADYGFTYNQGVMNFDCLVIPRGAPNKELAQRIIARVVSPEINARIVQTSGLSPANLLAIEKGIVPPDVAKDLAVSPENLRKIILANNAWWAENRQKLRLNERYNELKAK
jgi:putative spermidine/putrescine transport system substrate-binding protein